MNLLNKYSTEIYYEFGNYYENITHVKLYEHSKNNDISHLGHFYDMKTEYQKNKDNVIDIENIRFMDNEILYSNYFPNNVLEKCTNYCGGYGGNITDYGAHGGACSIKKEILNKVKWKDRKDLYFSPGYNNKNYRGAEDYEFHMECLFYLKKSMIIDSKIYYY